VVAYSSGNHAQGVALAARLLGVPATIVMPADAPRVKLDNTRELGARVVTYDRLRESREEIGDAIAAETGAVLVRPYDDPLVMAGQGTLGLEIAEQAEAAGRAARRRGSVLRRRRAGRRLRHRAPRAQPGHGRHRRRARGLRRHQALARGRPAARPRRDGPDHLRRDHDVDPGRAHL
jgi:hypothetical protein